MKTKKFSKIDIFKYVIIGLLTVFFISAAFLLLKEWEKYSGKFPEHIITEDTIKYSGAEYSLKEDVTSFLIIGLDKFDRTTDLTAYNNDQQADFLMLFVFDNEAETCSIVHINRDTMSNVNILGVNGNRVNTVIEQIALSHTYGNGKDVSCRNTSDAVSDLLLGMKINHYISITMDAVPVLNDLIGGVEVEILEDFSNVDKDLIKGEVITLKGQQALTYIRARSNLEDSTNISRMKRQQQYINAVYTKLKVSEDFENLSEKAIEISQYIISDLSVTKLQDFADKFKEYTFNGIYDIEGESKIGDEFMEFYPNYDSIKELVIDLYYKQIEKGILD